MPSNHLIEKILKYAQRQAEKGLVQSTLDFLKDAQQHAAEINVRLSEERIEWIKETAYKKGLAVYLFHAQNLSKCGNVESVLATLSNAMHCATRIGLNIPREVLCQTVETAYKKGIEECVASAKRHAEQRSPFDARYYLKDAQKYAAAIEIDISDKVREIEETINRKNTIH